MRMHLFDHGSTDHHGDADPSGAEFSNATVDAVRVGTGPELVRLVAQVQRAGSRGVAGLLGRVYVLDDLEPEAQREIDQWAEDARGGQRASIIAGLHVDDEGGVSVAGISHLEVAALVDALAQILSSWPGSYRITPTRFDVALDLAGDRDDEEEEDSEEGDDGDLDEDEFGDEEVEEVEDEDEQEADEDEPVEDEAVGAVVALLILKVAA